MVGAIKGNDDAKLGILHIWLILDAECMIISPLHSAHVINIARYENNYHTKTKYVKVNDG